MLHREDDIVTEWDLTPEEAGRIYEEITAKARMAKKLAGKVTGLADICICGHSVNRHQLVGKSYARCVQIGPNPCMCAMASRAVIQVRRGDDSDMRHFRGAARGSQKHPLTSGINASGEIKWLTRTCDRCSALSDDLEASALDDYDIPMIGRKPETRHDTGKHQLLCPNCVTRARDRNNLGTSTYASPGLDLINEMGDMLVEHPEFRDPENFPYDYYSKRT